MARYADTLLAEGERIVLRSRQHWFATLIDGRYPWLIGIVGLLLLVLASGLGDNVLRSPLQYVALVALLVALLWLIRVYWAWWAQDYLVTNRRVIKVEGILNKHSADSSLEKINDAVLDQNIIGRLLGYGDLDILTAAEEQVDRYRMLDHAPAFKREMLNQKQLLEQSYSRGPAGQGSAPSAPVVSPRPPMSPDEVTRTLAQLADLRDRGAITPDEYERKKADLLGRL